MMVPLASPEKLTSDEPWPTSVEHRRQPCFASLTDGAD